jgi:hypothetical protein
MRARSFLVGIVAAVLVMTLANVSWADGRGRGWHPAPPAPTIAPDIGTTTRRGPCICPRLELFTCLRLGLCMLPRQGPCTGEVSSGPGLGYRYREWGSRCLFTYRSRVDSLGRDSRANSFRGR